AVASRDGDAAREELRERVLEERLEAYRVHALLQVDAEAPQARAVPGREADEFHQRKVTPARRQAATAPRRAGSARVRTVWKVARSPRRAAQEVSPSMVARAFSPSRSGRPPRGEASGR